ncbi:MAG: histidine kinase dimerization/phospho-acceptor domain-containing protein, partial [Myxococcota bacterium]
MNSSFPIAQLSEDHDVLGMELQAWGLIAVLEATEEEVGRERVDEVFDSWGIDVRGLLQRRAWTTLEFAERFMDAMVGLAGEHIVHRAGWRAMSPRYLGPIYPLLRAVGSIRGTIHQIAKQGPRFNKAFHQSVSETGPGQVVLRFVLAPGVEQPRTRHFFTFVRAQAEAVPALFGGRPASVREQQLGRTTEFNVEWDEEGLSLPNWPLYPVSVLAVFIAALAAGVGTGAAVAMSLFGGAATHVFYEARRPSDEALRYLNHAHEYREGLVESARESESRFGDLLEAKAGVEREVAQRTSELKATSEQLAATLDEVRKLSQARTDFFSNVSHELRTPLTLLLSPLGQLVRGQEPPGGYDAALASMERNATRLLNTINQLLDLEQI